MAITLTPVALSFSTENFGTGSFPTSSFAPANPSTLVICVSGVANDTVSVSSALTISGGGFTYTRKVIAETIIAGNDFSTWWTAPVTSSASIQLTIDCSNVNVYQYFIHIFYATGASSTQNGTTGTYTSAGGGTPVTYSLGANPASDSYVMANGVADGGGTITDSSGWTTGFDSGGVSPIKSNTQYRTTSTSSQVRWAVLEQSVDGVASSAFELTAASSAAVDNFYAVSMAVSGTVQQVRLVGY